MFYPEMQKVRIFLALLFTFMIAGTVSASESSQNPDSLTTIINVIEKDSIIVIRQPAGLSERLIHDVNAVGQENNEQQSLSPEQSTSSNDENSDAASGMTVKSAGYRVQVFSDNNVKTAKNEARSKANAISSKFPQFKTYVVFQSPYWRLKVGDFPTQAEAQNALEMIKRAFPNYSRELRIVKDRINRRVN